MYLNIIISEQININTKNADIKKQSPKYVKVCYINEKNKQYETSAIINDKVTALSVINI